MSATTMPTPMTVAAHASYTPTLLTTSTPFARLPRLRRHTIGPTEQTV
jgi:hypothetical protein